MATNLRRIQALSKVGINSNEPGDPPIVQVIKLSQLRVNDEYQRQIGRESITLIRKIANNFNWKKFRPPVITPTGEKDELTGLEVYEVLDGQHTAIGAATNGKLKVLPCWVVETADLVEKAETFVGLNRERINVSTLNVFWAEVTAGNEEALEVVAACVETGASVVHRPPPYGDYAIGETVCVSALKSIASKGGKPWLKRILATAVECKLAPISQVYILALKALLLEPGYLKLKDDHDVAAQKIALVVNGLTQEELLTRATVMHRSSAPSERHSLATCLATQIKIEVDTLNAVS